MSAACIIVTEQGGEEEDDLSLGWALVAAEVGFFVGSVDSLLLKSIEGSHPTFFFL